MATQKIKREKGIVRKKMKKFSIRMDDNLRIRVIQLAIKNNINFTKMLNYLVELGYQVYMKKYEKDYLEIGGIDDE